ncbi:hypothetical protein K1719_039346 [Acacia pycnantha]|nr:hypothetical protein K1719_039346 [Acacia pycnantha]
MLDIDVALCEVVLNVITTIEWEELISVVWISLVVVEETRLSDMKIERVEAGIKIGKACHVIRVDFSNPLCPIFNFDEKEKERLMKPFRRTLIVKLMGRKISYGFMVNKLRLLWARKGGIDVFDMENEFYLVNFQDNNDYMEAVIRGPWVDVDAYLNVARWRPDFNPKNAKIDSFVAWSIDGEMKVEGKGSKTNAEAMKEDIRGHWKTVARIRRTRSNVSGTLAYQEGSRFSVLMKEEKVGEQVLEEHESQ